ncbi:MAG: DUF1559 domain-containing protein, partial [Planctomycetia bacterium]
SVLKIRAFVCPSDPFVGGNSSWNTTGSVWESSYAANNGWPRQSTGVGGERTVTAGAWPKPNGMLSVLYSAEIGVASTYFTGSTQGDFTTMVSARSVLDGMTKTACYSERLVAEFGSSPVDDRLNRYTNSTYTATEPLAQMVNVCNTTPINLFNSQMGGSWQFGLWTVGNAYQHLMTPNQRHCLFGNAAEFRHSMNTAFTAGSYHPGGCNVVFGDGSVAFVSSSVGQEVWWAYGSRDGEEAAVGP